MGDDDTDLAVELYAALGPDRKADGYGSVPADLARRALDEVHALRRDLETATTRLSSATTTIQQYRTQMGALMVDRDRARNWAVDLVEGALRVAAERGIDAEDVQRQIAHDRHLRWLQLREEVWHQSGFDAVAEVVFGTPHDAPTVSRKALLDALDANKRHAEVDRRCGKTYEAKPLPDLSIPPPREVVEPIQGDLFDDVDVA